jgi:hypothetical protein
LVERRSNISHCVENQVWKRLWAFRKADQEMNDTAKDLLYMCDVKIRKQLWTATVKEEQSYEIQCRADVERQ